jgi:energy-coupling factor transport system substrate-specific component
MFGWPLLLPAAPAAVGHAADAPFAFVLILPVLVVLAIVQLSEGGMDAKAVAMLGVLSAVNAALRPLGAGTGGIETVFFLLILAGRVFGPGFGFMLGCTSLFASALLTAAVGPWLPFQMMASAWVGMLAGLLPDRLVGRELRGRREIALLAAYGAAAAYVFGAIMNLWFWPFIAGADAGNAGIAYSPGAPISQNLAHFGLFTLVTSTATWDTGRAVTDIVLVVVLGPAILGALRRASRRANFAPLAEFDPR